MAFHSMAYTWGVIRTTYTGPGMILQVPSLKLRAKAPEQIFHPKREVIRLRGLPSILRCELAVSGKLTYPTKREKVKHRIKNAGLGGDISSGQKGEICCRFGNWNRGHAIEYWKMSLQFLDFCLR